MFDLSKVKCEICKEIDLNEIYSFYRCIECKKNMCSLCKDDHDKTHKIINYNEKEYTCDNHNSIFLYYCTKCRTNMCFFCQKEHTNHNVNCFGNMIPDLEYYKSKMNKIEEKINKFNKVIENLKNKFNQIVDFILHSYKYFFSIAKMQIYNYKIETVNYEILHNIEIMCGNELYKDLDYFINENNIKNQLRKVLDIYDKCFTKYIDKFKINYKITKNVDKIKIFGNEFVKKNKNKCTLKINFKEYDLEEEINIKNSNLKDNLEITLLGIKNITDISHMFSGCSSLLSISDISNWKTTNSIDMNSIFNGC